MSLLIKADNKQLRLKLTEDEESKLFMKLLQTALGFKVFDESELKHTSKPVEQIPETFPELTVKTSQEPNESGYKGFMLIQCEHCGKIKGYCIKEKQNQYFCTDCKEITKFKDNMKRLYLNCGCGTTSGYWTNIIADIMDVNCIECGAPVPVKYNDKKNIYETLR